MIAVITCLVLAVLAAVGAIALQVMNNHGTEEVKVNFTLPVLVAVVTFTVLAAINSIVLINAGSVGVVTRFGAVTGVNFDQGIHTKAPFIEGVTTFDVRTQKDQVDASAASKDLQTVNATVAVNYHLEAKSASTVYKEVGTHYKERIIDPAVQESFKFTTAQFTAEELITQRESVKVKAREFLKERMAKFHIIVDEFNIVNFDFSPAFNAAIEQKQVAQQNVEKAKRDLERITVEAQQKVAEARGTAESQALLRPNLTPEYLNYLAVQKWNGVLPQATNGLPFLQLPINK